LIIPILIYGSSEEKMIHKDNSNNPLISLNAAVNAAYALYNTSKYNNNRDANINLNNRLTIEAKQGRKPKRELWEAITIDPIVVTLYNIK